MVEVTRRRSNSEILPKRLVREVRRVRQGGLNRSVSSESQDQRGPVAEHRTRRELTTEELELIESRFRDGVLMKIIAADLEIDRRKVRKVLYDAGITQPKTPLTPMQVAAAARMYEDGGSLATVGGRFGVSAGTIRAKLLTAGVEIRPRVGGPAPRRAV